MKIYNLVLASVLATSCGGEEAPIAQPVMEKKNPKISQEHLFGCEIYINNLIGYCGSVLCNKEGKGNPCEYNSQETKTSFTEKCEDNKQIERSTKKQAEMKRSKENRKNNENEK